MFIAEGTVIDGKFELRGTIGHGGMGIVYEANQLGLDRIVALKLLFSLPEDSRDEIARFEREALILSKLSHINIVQFYAYGTWSGFPYIAMERLRGDSLQKILAKNEPVAVSDTIEYARQICDGLEHAHSHGIMHRDIKPTNIILSTGSDGRFLLKVIDFGLAKLMGSNLQKLTQTNTALGSVQYMSPEQCTGTAGDHRSDIYSLGCLIYHCLIGEPPYCAENAVAVMFRQVNEPVQNSAEWHRLPPALQNIVARCMEKEPANRFQSCGELQDELIQAGQSDSVLVGNSTLRPAVSSKTPVDLYTGQAQPSSRNMIWAAVLCASCALVGGTVWYANIQPPPVSLDASASSSSAAETMTNLIYQYERRKSQTNDFPLNRAQVDQLAQATEKCRHASNVDADTILGADLIMVRHYGTFKEIEKIRSILSASMETGDKATKSTRYVEILYLYHTLCALSGCELSLVSKLESVKQRFPNMPLKERNTVDLLLSEDYIQLGRASEARQLCLAVLKRGAPGYPEFLDRATLLIKKMDSEAGKTAPAKHRPN